jgi:hypothetical protein
MGRSEIACARCGRWVPVDRLAMWQQYEQYRVFQGPPVRGGGAAVDHDRTIYANVRRHCAYLTCEACHDRLQRGGRLDDIHNRKVAAFILAVFVFGALIVSGTPSAIPTLLATFWRL